MKLDHKSYKNMELKGSESSELPIVDMSKPLNPSCMKSLSEACKEWGFFYIINHGVSRDLYKKLHNLSNQLFRLPMESKLKVGPSSYTPHFIASPFFESFRVSGPHFLASAQTSSQLLQSKTIASEFSETVEEYGKKMTEVSKKIVEILLMMLGDGFNDKFYQSEFAKCHGYLRIINYSSSTTLEEEEEIKEEVEGLGMHTDMSCITIVYQDEVGGLQVRSNEGKWMHIKPCEDTLVVNIGDLMQAWTNGRLSSSQHRVVLNNNNNIMKNNNKIHDDDDDGVNYVKKDMKKKIINGCCCYRFSLAFFWCFEDEKVIFAPDDVVGEDGFRVYKPFLCSDYNKFREIKRIEIGKFEKVGYTVKDFAGL